MIIIIQTRGDEPLTGSVTQKEKDVMGKREGEMEGPQFVERLLRVLGLSIGVIKTMTFGEERVDFIWYFQVTLYHEEKAKTGMEAES